MSGLGKTGYGGTSLGPLQGAGSERTFTADMCAPANSNTPITTSATVVFDDNAVSKAVREFEETLETAVCLHFRVPENVTQMRFRLAHRAKTAPADSRNVVVRLHAKVGAAPWEGPQALGLVPIPPNAFPQSITLGALLSVLGVSPGDDVALLLSRNTASPTDTLEHPWLLYEVGVSFE